MVWFRFFASVGTVLAVGGVLPASATPPPEPASSQINKVTVYNRTAKVWRKATVQLAGDSQKVALADLPATVLTDTVQVSCPTARVHHVTVALGQTPLPRQAQARALTQKIQQLLDQLRTLGHERSLWQEELSLLSSLTPREPPATPAVRPPGPARLFVDAWQRIMEWVDSRGVQARQRLLELDTQQEALNEQLFRLQVEGRELLSAGQAGRVNRVWATLQGKPGTHRVTVTYLVRGVQWRPAYDLSYDHHGRSVRATYYAAVTQNTGEDWADARLRFSTTVPVRLLAVPELPTWTLGHDKEFSPQPRKHHDPAPPHWQPSPPETPTSLALTQLRSALQQSRNVADSLPSSGATEGEPASQMRDERLEELMDNAVAHQKAPPPPPRPRPSPSRVAPMAPPPQPTGAPEADMEPPPADSTSLFGAVLGRESAPSPVTVPWTDQGYRPPHLDPNSPAAAAKGYSFSLAAPGRHDVPTEHDPRRIPLLRRTFSVTPVYRVRPGISPWAYLQAQVENDTGKPVLQGHANLFLGTMYSGTTWLDTALPGKKITLPLGIDDSVKVARHQRQTSKTDGLVFKDQVTEYVVEIEIANHRSYPISVWVEDQVPLVGPKEEEAELKGFSSASFSKPDKKGKVAWKGRVGARAVKKLSFRYQLIRPKGWELRQL